MLNAILLATRQHRAPALSRSRRRVMTLRLPAILYLLCVGGSWSACSAGSIQDIRS